MNKGELVDKLAEKASASLDRAVTKKEVDAVITATIEAIMEAVAQGEKATPAWDKIPSKLELLSLKPVYL